TTVVRLMAPFAPFIAEDLYQELVVKPVGASAAESVHLLPWPVADRKAWHNADILRAGDVVLHAASLGRSARKQSGVKVRQPLGRMMIHLDSATDRETIQKNAAVLLDELNVKAIEFLDESAGILDYR